jgi:hypothetical protein
MNFYGKNNKKLRMRVLSVLVVVFYGFGQMGAPLMHAFYHHSHATANDIVCDCSVQRFGHFHSAVKINFHDNCTLCHANSITAAIDTHSASYAFFTFQEKLFPQKFFLKYTIHFFDVSPRAPPAV